MWRHSHVKTIRPSGHFRLSMLHDARMQNAVQTWQLRDLPHKYVRYRYPVHVICETWAHWLHSSRLSHTSCTPRWPSCAEVSRSYADLHHFSSRDENAIDIAIPTTTHAYTTTIINVTKDEVSYYSPRLPARGVQRLKHSRSSCSVPIFCNLGSKRLVRVVLELQLDSANYIFCRARADNRLGGLRRLP